MGKRKIGGGGDSGSSPSPSSTAAAAATTSTSTTTTSSSSSRSTPASSSFPYRRRLRRRVLGGGTSSSSSSSLAERAPGGGGGGGFGLVPTTLVGRVLSFLPAAAFARARPACRLFDRAAGLGSTRALLASPIDYLAPARLALFHGGRGRCQRQAFVSVGPAGRYYALFWTSEARGTEEWRGHAEVFDVLEGGLVVDRHCRTPEVGVEGDFFSVCFLEADFGFGRRPHVLFSTPKGKCTVHDLAHEGAIRCTLSASTFHSHGEIASEYFEYPDGTGAIVTADSGESKLEVAGARARGPGGLAIWILPRLGRRGDKGDGAAPADAKDQEPPPVLSGTRCEVLDYGSPEKSMRSSALTIGCNGRRLLRGVHEDVYYSHRAYIEVWDTLSYRRVRIIRGDEFWLSPGLDGSLLFTQTQSRDLAWTSVLAPGRPSRGKRGGRAGPPLPWRSLHGQPIHTVCGLRRPDGSYEIVTVDEDSVMLKWEPTRAPAARSGSRTGPRGGASRPPRCSWVLAGGDRVYSFEEFKRRGGGGAAGTADQHAEFAAKSAGSECPYLISCVQIMPQGTFVLGVYAKSYLPGGGKWQGNKHRYSVMLHSLRTGVCLLEMDY